VDWLADAWTWLPVIRAAQRGPHREDYGQQIHFHLIPSGILRPRPSVLIGNGVVVSPKRSRANWRPWRRWALVSKAACSSSENAHVIMPFHRQLDVFRSKHAAKARSAHRPRDRQRLYGQGRAVWRPRRRFVAAEIWGNLADRNLSH